MINVKVVGEILRYAVLKKIRSTEYRVNKNNNVCRHELLDDIIIRRLKQQCILYTDAYRL